MASPLTSASRGSVQQGLYAAGSVLGFSKLGLAADKRYSLGRESTMGFLSGLFNLGPSRERLAAQRFGIAVEEVSRELPQFERGNKSVKLSRGSCVRYAVPRLSPLPRENWLLLQRTEADGAQFPNGYLLVCSGPPSAALESRLTSVASEYDEELFEFEATDSEVAVFWEEWGAERQVERLAELLTTLAQL